MKNLPKVSAVIPSYNCKNNLFRLLRSLKDSKYANLEVIVVDNGSRDDTLKEGRRRFKWVKWFDAGEENIGQTGCYNIGLSLAQKSDYVLYVDSDVIVEKGMIEKMIDRMNANKKIGIVTPMILYLKNKNLVNQAGAEVDLVTGRVSVGWGKRKDHLVPQQVQNSGTLMLFKNEVLKKIGGFDDWFLCYFDSDYCLRAKKAGFETWYEPEAICYHDQSANPDVWRPRVLQRAYLLGRNRVLFMRRHGTNLKVFMLCLPIMLGFYLIESIKFNQLNKFFELVWGTIKGFFHPLKKGNHLALPKVKF